MIFRFCHTGLMRDIDGPVTGVLFKILCRKPEVGARTLVHGACAGPESHGQYLPDCKITPTSKGLCKGPEGDKLQKRVWDELREKLDGIRPGVTAL